MPTTLGHAIPILRIFSEEKAREFYVDFLGFCVEWEHRFEPGFPVYMEVRRGDLVLHLSEHSGDATPGSTVFVPATEIDSWQRELVGKEYKYLRPGVEAMPWGHRVMSLTDPFGNTLRISERIAERGAEYSMSVAQ